METMSTQALIIDPPHEAAFDIKVAKRWVKELEALALQGYNVGRHMIKAKKDLALLKEIQS